ncbi:MAG: PQQ-binding-like beta-propeller repeat protein, partial [Actinobacteria bacterium]|nr:PQQ-binding-like beta-propeller repeat protein [Actinomycetota bacterium]
MYVTTAGGRVLALNAATGEELWRHEPTLGTVTLCCGPSNSGVTALGNMVYVASLDARLLALNARTGEPVWEAPLADPAVLRYLLGGLVNTLKAAGVAMAGAMVIGGVMALARLAQNRPVRWLAGIY